MLVVLSPARNVRPMHFPGIAPTPPLFPEHVAHILAALRQFSPLALESVLDANPDMAMDLFVRYQHFDLSDPGTPALSSYSGAAYRNLNTTDFTLEDFAFAQAHLRIFSALYGLLRPSDGILPHRLGLRCPVQVNGDDLYTFWGNRIYEALFPQTDCIVNLASMEYTQLALPYRRACDRMLTCRFLQQKPSGPRGSVATVRAARGQMARYLIKHRITVPEGLQGFDTDGYRFIPSMSDPSNYVFIQPVGRLCHPP